MFLSIGKLKPVFKIGIFTRKAIIYIEITFSPQNISEKLAEMIHCQKIKLGFSILLNMTQIVKPNKNMDGPEHRK